LAPSASLASQTTYTATVSGALDLAGNLMTVVSWSFTTADTIPPTIVAAAPAANATSIGVATSVTARFSEAVQAGTISFVLTDASGNAVGASGSYNAPSLTATLTPSAPLVAQTTYTAIVSGALDMAGNVMVPVSWSFTTSAAPDTVAPTVVANSPA